MQSDWKCCGINKPDDWDINEYFNSNTTRGPFRSVEANGVPFSCCLDAYKYREENLPNQACGFNVRNDVHVIFFYLKTCFLA